MVDLNFLLEAEGTGIKELLLNALDRIKGNQKIEKEELSFNVLIVTVYPKKNEVVIMGECFPEDGELVMSIDQFRSKLTEA